MNITSSHVFNRVMLFVLREMDGILRALLGMDGQDSSKAADVAKLPRWRKMEPLVRSYVGNALHILNQVWCKPFCFSIFVPLICFRLLNFLLYAPLANCFTQSRGGSRIAFEVITESAA
jgi:hypothetical protein